MKKFIYILLVAAGLCACNESLEDRVAREAAEYTKKNCPVRIAENIVNDSMAFNRETRTVVYYYSIETPNDSNTIDNAEVKKQMKEGVINATNLKMYKEAGLSFRYVFFSAKSKKLFCNILITEKDYNVK